MNIKGNTKRAGKVPDFWPSKRQRVIISPELKEWVINQYYSQDTLNVYCDASIKSNIIGVACSYVINGSVQVKHKFVHAPRNFKVIYPWYAEIKGIIFALNNFEKYVETATNVIIYSDLLDIYRVLESGPMFRKNTQLQEVRKELQSIYRAKHLIHKDKLSIEYLPKEKKKYNPFYKSAHNAANILVSE